MRYAVLEQGRVRIPDELLSEAGLAPGSLVVLRLEGDRIVVRPVNLGAASEPISLDSR
ncbi:MAG: AbrB/MazE/SpoVT family DNA-binding domain-containing protein [Thermaerobacter sp.]|nr:AbrB/MazE/SpoVT family DNA-binding domain-containing protein [Thermaerobacter sp.]